MASTQNGTSQNVTSQNLTSEHHSEIADEESSETFNLAIESMSMTDDSYKYSNPDPDHHFYTDHVMMCEPTAFYLNEETIEDNAFMKRVSYTKEESSRIALQQFHDMVENLRRNNIKVTSYKQQADHLPDSVFPDWFTTVRQPGNASEGVFFTYPMKTESRRGEYNPEIVKELGANYGSVIAHQPAIAGQSLEGKGSLVLDNKLRKVYCCISERACLETVQSFVDTLNQHCQKPYRLVQINGFDPVTKTRIYHTDVMFAMLDKHIVCCLDAIVDPIEKEALLREMQEGGRKVVNISNYEMTQMCGNMVQVKDGKTG